MTIARQQKRFTVKRRMHSLLVSLSLSLSLMLVPACGIPDSIEKATQDATTALAQAQAEIQAQSANWRQVLDRLTEKVNDLRAEVRGEISAGLTAIVDRAAHTVGEQFRCSVDFLGARISDGLQRLIDKLNNKTTPVRPAICGVTPSAIRLDLAPDLRRTVEWSGYNFDAAGVRVVLVRKDKSELDVTHNLSRQSHYHFTLSLGGPTPADGVQLDNNSDRLLLLWDRDEVSAVDVQQPTPQQPKACVRESFAYAPQPVTFMPPHTRGDKEFFGHVDILIQTSLIPERTGVKARIYMKAEQFRDDKTTAEGEITVDAVTAGNLPPNRRIESVVGPLEAPLRTYHDDDPDPDYFDEGSGVVRSYTVQGDRYGDDAGVWTQVTVAFNPITMSLIQTGDCVN